MHNWIKFLIIRHALFRITFAFCMFFVLAGCADEEYSGMPPIILEGKELSIVLRCSDGLEIFMARNDHNSFLTQQEVEFHNKRFLQEMQHLIEETNDLSSDEKRLYVQKNKIRFVNEQVLIKVDMLAPETEAWEYSLAGQSLMPPNPDNLLKILKGSRKIDFEFSHNGMHYEESFVINKIIPSDPFKNITIKNAIPEYWECN